MASSNQGSGFVDAAQNNLREGAIVGAGAFVANYIIVYILTAIDGISAGSVSTWKAVGWVFYAAHNVKTEASAAGMSQSINYLESASGSNLTSTVPKLVYYLVPVVVLLAAGYVLYDRVGGNLDTEAAAGAGATLAAGYVVLAAVGTFLFEASMGGVSVAPKMMTGIVVAGLAYPIIFGAIGSVAASEA